MKIAILSDIHGNITALKAVLAQTKTEKIDEYWLLGDLVMPGPGAGDLLALLRTLPVTASIRGNWDDCLLEFLGKAPLNDATDVYIARLSQYVAEHLSEADIEEIKNLPLQISKRVNGLNFSLTHNLPDKNWGGDLIPHAEQANFDRLFGEETDVAIYGHVHHQTLRYDSKDRLIINPGSVGQPFSYWKNLREQRAQYAILEIDEQGQLEVHFKRVPYDNKKEFELAKSRNLPYLNLYKEQLETGILHTHDLELLEKINRENQHEESVRKFFGY